MAKSSLAELFDEALQLHQIGRLAPARAKYQKLLKLDPNQPDALHLLGLVEYQTGKPQKAVSLISKAIARHDQQPMFHTNLAIVLNSMGRADEAEQSARRALALNPDDEGALTNLGAALITQGNPDEAEPVLRRAIEINSLNTDAQGNLGVILNQAGRTEEARAAFEAALVADSDNVRARASLGDIYRQQGDYEQAIAACEGALAIEGDFVDALIVLGNTHSDRFALEPAEEAYRRALAAEPSSPRALASLAVVHLRRNQADKALARLDEALSGGGELAELHHNRGVALSALGDLDEAIEAFKKAAALDPNSVETFSELVKSKRHTIEPARIEYMSRRLEGGDINADETIKLAFGLGELQDKAGNPDVAIGHFHTGNSRKKAFLEATGHRFVREHWQEPLDICRDVFTPAFFAERGDMPLETATPVFVVGVPRSGTTLVERIIASHPDGVGAGETGLVGHVLAENTSADPGPSAYAGLVADADQAMIRQMAQTILEQLAEGHGEAGRVVEKTPFNFKFMGAIQLLFADAKIINCRRDPRDMGISCYFQDFADPNSWSYDLGDIGFFLNIFDQFSTLWREVLPSPILDVHYEDLVADLGGGARRIIDYIGLPWDDQCLEFHRSVGAVHTASKWQVRQPVYHSSVERWRPYADHLGPLLAELG